MGKKSCLCTIRLALTNHKSIDVPALFDPGASCRLLIHRQLAQTLIKSGCYHAPVAYPTKICGYNGSGPQSITHKVVTKISVPGTSFTDSTCSFSIIDMAQRSYQVIVGWHYIQDKRIIIDGAKPCLILRTPLSPSPSQNPRPPLPHAKPEPERNSEPAVPSLPKLPTKILKRGEPLPEPPVPEPSRPGPSTTRPMGLKQFKRMVNRTRGQGLGIAVIFNEPDPDTVIASLAPALPGSAIAAITRADIESHRANKEKPKTDPRAKLPKEYHDFLDLCEPDAPPPESKPHRDFEITLTPGADPHRDVGFSPLRRMSDDELREVKHYLDENLANGNISPSSAPIASPVLFARKADGSLRFCIDFRKLNAITQKDRYPLPRIDEVLRLVIGAKYLSKIDIRLAFHRVAVALKSRPLTTFRTAYGAYQCNVMPFGLSNAPSTWQRVINDALFEGLGSFCCAYVDDILIWSKSLGEHRRDVRRVLETLRRHGFRINVDKCDFHVQETKYLGHILSTTGVRPDPDKIKVLLDWETPRNLKEVQAFHGLGNYYRKNIGNFARIARPLTNLMKKEAPFAWTPECETSFTTIKRHLADAAMQYHFDPKLPTVLAADASDGTTGAALHQLHPGPDQKPILRPIAFSSKTMLMAELNYPIYDKELLAIIRALEE